MKDTIQILKDIWKDRLLLFSLSTKDFQRKYSGTFFGIFWAIAQPLLTIIVYWVAFQYGFKSPDVDAIPYAVWFICGIVPWLYVTESFSSASNCFIEYNYLIKKEKFNVVILPLVKILSAFYIHIFFCLIAVGVAVGLKVWPTVYIIQLLYYMVANIILLFALSLITSSIVVFFRDLNQIISVILLIGMWGTPIAWTLAGFPEAIHKYFKLNPFFYIIEGYRDAILGRQWFWEHPHLTLYFWVFVIILLVIGGRIYVKLRPHFADTV